MVDAVHSERDLVWRNETLEFHIQVEACAGENLCAVQGIKGLGLTLWNRADNHREREHRPAHGYKSCPACSGSKTACRGSLCTVRCEARQRRRARRLALRGGNISRRPRVTRCQERIGPDGAYGSSGRVETGAFR